MEKLELHLTTEEEIILEMAIEDSLTLYYRTYLEMLRYKPKNTYKDAFNDLYQLRKKLQDKNILTILKDEEIDIMYNAINK